MTWLATALPYNPRIIYEIAFDYVDPNLVLAATSYGMYQSLDAGKTWTFHYGGMPKDDVTSVIFHPLHHGEAYALHYGWIYRTTDGGVTWKVFDRAGLGNVTFHTITFDSSDSNPQLYGLAPLRGVFAYHAHEANPATNVPSHPQTTFN